MSKKIVYIAAPYTNGDVAENVRKVITVADKLVELGYLPFVPHLTHFWHIISPKPKEFWLELDLAFLPFCDYLLRLPGESSGADNEVLRAMELHIPVCFNLMELESVTIEGTISLQSSSSS